MDSHQVLEYIKRVQAIAQAGITYAENGYDLERYEELRSISAGLMTGLTDEPLEKIRGLFTNEDGYQTPKVDIRAAIFKGESILLVKENADGFWSLPGGWADVGYSPAEVAVKEVEEEAGISVMAKRILAILDKKFHPHPPSPYHTYKIFIECEQIGGVLEKGMETSDVAFYNINAVPQLSEERITQSQIQLLYKLHLDKGRPTVFD